MRLARIAVSQLGAEQRLYWRNAASAFFTFLLPIVLLAFVGAVGHGSRVDGVPYPTFVVPGMLAMAVVLTTFAGLAITLTIRRENGILKRMRATPLPPAVYLGALIGSLVLVLVLETVVVLALGRLAFDVPLPGSSAGLVAAVALGAACFAPLGVALSRFVPHADGSSAVVNAVYIPMLLLSGAFFPLHELPSLLRGIADALPLTHLLQSLRAAFAGGSAFGDLSGLGVLLLWGAFGVVLAARTFRWEPNVR